MSIELPPALAKRYAPSYTADWEQLKTRLMRYLCPCGSGGPLACEDDCPGETTDLAVRDAIVALIDAVKKLEGKV